MCNGSYKFTQHALIDDIIFDINLTDAKMKPVPAKVSMPLHAFKDAPPFKLNFNYCSVVGKLNYLIHTSRSNIMYATHQIAKYSSNWWGLMGKPFSIWFVTWRRPKTLAFTSSLCWTSDLSVTVTQISQAIGISHLLTLTPIPPSLGVDRWYSTQDVLSSGLPNFNLRQLYLPQ